MMRTFVGIIFMALITFPYVSAAGEFDAESWSDINIVKYNKIIKEAFAKKKEWVDKPEFYAHYLLGLNETKDVLYSIKANRMEMPTEFTLKLKRQGLLDDSVSGDIHMFVLNKTDKGYWEVVAGKRALSCWRTKSKGFQSNACP